MKCEIVGDLVFLISCSSCVQISNNVQPEVDAILDVEELFAKYPFGYSHLLRRHKIHLVCVWVFVSSYWQSVFYPSQYSENYSCNDRWQYSIGIWLICKCSACQQNAGSRQMHQTTHWRSICGFTVLADVWLRETVMEINAVLRTNVACFSHVHTQTFTNFSDGTIYRIVSNIAIVRSYRGISLSR